MSGGNPPIGVAPPFGGTRPYRALPARSSLFAAGPSLFGEDEEAEEWAGELFAQSPAQRIPLVAGQGQVKRRSDAACFGDCRAPTPRASENFLKCVMQFTLPPGNARYLFVAVAIEAVARRPAWTGRDEQSGYTDGSRRSRTP